MDLTINKIADGGVLTVEVVGDLDTNTAADFQKDLLEAVATSKSTVLDFKSLNYVSSAGLRALLIIQKEVEKNSAELKIVNMPEKIREVFDMVGFSDLFTIE
ncbi:hypothetical protein FACS1894125_6150 [Actinomycetota bacterium]|nr:hypothetical protein FACS1894125_6150 [Actinomycetota bacterium]